MCIMLPHLPVKKAIDAETDYLSIDRHVISLAQGVIQLIIL